jgi:hypothetical protein
MGDVDAVYLDASLVGIVEGAEEVEKSRLARARWPGHGHNLTWMHFEIDPSQGHDWHAAQAVALDQPGRNQARLGFCRHGDIVTRSRRGVR